MRNRRKMVLVYQIVVHKIVMLKILLVLGRLQKFFTYIQLFTTCVGNNVCPVYLIFIVLRNYKIFQMLAT